jgi:hypothetical protein
LSTAILASGRAARIPDAYAADGSITTILIAFRNASLYRLFAFDRGALPGQWVHAARRAALVSRIRAW